MISLDQRLGEAIGKMSSEQLKEYNRRTTGKGLPQENLCNVSEAVLANFQTQQRITRNNGAQRDWSQESEHSPEKSEAMLLEGLRKARPQAFAGYDKIEEVAGSVSNLSESQKKEFAWCRQLGMSESDSLSVARKS